MKQIIQVRLEPVFHPPSGTYDEVLNLIIEVVYFILSMGNIQGTFLAPSSIELVENGKKSPGIVLLLRSVYVPYSLS
jgi:hypothetical protein